MTSFSGSWTINRAMGANTITVVISVTVNGITQAQAQVIATDGDSVSAGIGTVVSSSKVFNPDSVILP